MPSLLNEVGLVKMLNKAQAGGSVLETMAGLMIFALAATSFGIVLPLAVGRATADQARLALAELMESCLEETRAEASEKLTVGKTEWIEVGQLQYQRETSYVKLEMVGGKSVWVITDAKREAVCQNLAKQTVITVTDGKHSLRGRMLSF